MEQLWLLARTQPQALHVQSVLRIRALYDVAIERELLAQLQELLLLRSEIAFHLLARITVDLVGALRDGQPFAKCRAVIRQLVNALAQLLALGGGASAQVSATLFSVAVHEERGARKADQPYARQQAPRP